MISRKFAKTEAESFAIGADDPNGLNRLAKSGFGALLEVNQIRARIVQPAHLSGKSVLPFQLLLVTV
jgi:hypothetical protein